jgi:hypothetical protein
MSEPVYDPPLVHMPGTKLAPSVVLHRTLNKIDRIKSVVVVIQWDDDTYDVDWSSQKVSDLAFGNVILTRVVNEEIETR